VRNITDSRTFKNNEAPKENYIKKRVINFTIKGRWKAVVNTIFGILPLMIIFAGIFVIQFFQNKTIWSYLTLIESYSQKI
jgi:hypothetical protein